MTKVIKLPPNYKTNVPDCLRAIADSIEAGELHVPECMVLLCEDEEDVAIWQLGKDSDNLARTSGLLEMAKFSLLAEFFN